MTKPVTLSDLCVSFGTRLVLGGLSFAVPEGSMFGFVGPNGAGKTTTMRCLLGIIPPDSGRVEVLVRRPLARRAALSATCRRSAASIRR